MNFGIKTKTFNFLTTPSSIATAIDTLLEPGARIIGITATGLAAGDTVTWAISMVNIAGVEVPLASGQLTPPGAVQTSKSWWAGLAGKFNDTSVVIGATANTTQGVIPIGLPGKISEFNSATLLNWTVNMSFITALGGQCIVWYTVDPPTANEAT